MDAGEGIWPLNRLRPSFELPLLHPSPPMANASAAPLHPLRSSVVVPTAAASSSSRSPSLPSPPPDSIPVATNSSKPSINSLRRYAPLSRRRDLVAGFALSAVLWKEPPASDAREVEVGVPICHRALPTLPSSSSKPPPRTLPAFGLETCQPKCAEPWVEVKFEDDKQGKVQIVASPLIRLTNKPNAKIEVIGNPEKVSASLGPFVTGNTFDSDELLEASIEKRGDQTYYKYELETPFALTGSHNLAKATAKGNSVILFVASANDKQWPQSEKIMLSRPFEGKDGKKKSVQLE